MSWFKRTNKNINTKTEEKKDIPAGLWYKTPTGKVIETKELAENMYVSPEDDYHVHIGRKEYFEILSREGITPAIDTQGAQLRINNLCPQNNYEIGQKRHIRVPKK